VREEEIRKLTVYAFGEAVAPGLANLERALGDPLSDLLRGFLVAIGVIENNESVPAKCELWERLWLKLELTLGSWHAERSK
jgi:hypothetical protein